MIRLTQTIRRQSTFFLVFGWLIFNSSITLAEEDGVVVLSDTVVGNQEQPKVLYVVPWRSADDDTILSQPLSTTVGRDLFAHIERSEHQRELEYLQQLWQE